MFQRRPGDTVCLPPHVSLCALSERYRQCHGRQRPFRYPEEDQEETTCHFHPTRSSSSLPTILLEQFDAMFGLHPGFRPAHAKGVLLTGTFSPSPEAASLTRAPHISRESTPVTVRFSDSTGLPTIPDNDPNANPRGMAIRFHLAEHVHTDIIGHSTDGFPTRTGQEFLEFLRAAAASEPSKPSPSPIEVFLGDTSGRPGLRAGAQAQSCQLREGGLFRRDGDSVSSTRMGSPGTDATEFRRKQASNIWTKRPPRARTPIICSTKLTHRVAAGPIRLQYPGADRRGRRHRG